MTCEPMAPLLKSPMSKNEKTSDAQIKANRQAAAKRALAEAKERQAKAKPQTLATELGGRNGPEPTRFGDWEKKGIISDF